MFRTIPVRAKFSNEEQAYWSDQCEHTNSLINCALYEIRQNHFSRLADLDARTMYWRGDELCSGWKTYRVNVRYAELCRQFKENKHYKSLQSQSAQQALKTIVESINSYNALVGLYYQGEVDKPKVPRYRKSGGLAAVVLPVQALQDWDGRSFRVGVSREAKPDMAEFLGEVRLTPPHFIDPDTVREVRVRPNFGQFWVDWIIEDGKKAIKRNPNLDYTQVWGFDHGGCNWLTGVSTRGRSLIIDGRKLRSMNQGYSRLVAKYKQGKPEFYWDSNLDRIQRQRNNQMRDAINKAARFIVNQCLHDRIGNLVIGWNPGQKVESNMGKVNNQNFVPIPTGRLIERLKTLCPEYGIVLTVTEEAYTSVASSLDGDSLPVYGEKPSEWQASGKRIERGLYKTKDGKVINADCNAAFNIIRKVAKQLGVNLAEIGRAALTLPQRVDLFTRLDRSYRRKCEAATIYGVA